MICDDKRMCVLVTGASGMIGSEAVLGLLALGYRVIGVDRREGVIARDDYEHCVCDLSDEGAVRSMISSRRIDRIVHLAALAHSVDGSAFSWEDYYRLNVECARNIFEAAGKIPVLFISRL